MGTRVFGQRSNKLAFLPFLSILGHGKKGDRPLLVALVERWWDTTHTFHFDEVGEMMTLTDFTAIIGLHVGGKRLKYDLEIYKKIRTSWLNCLGNQLQSYWRAKGECRMKAFPPLQLWLACIDQWIIVLGAGPQAWVWACKYLKPFALSRPSETVNTWPRTLRLLGAKAKRDLRDQLVQKYNTGNP
ncbi:unnamed protein product [Prunus armeniaca]